MNRESLKIILCYATIYIVWGSTYFFIKISVETIPPFFVLGLRNFFGGTVFLSYSLFTGKIRPLPNIRETLSSILLGTLLLLGGNGLLTIAEREVDSYIAALIIASTPIMVAIYNRFIFKIGISALKLFGILIGIFGVGFLLYDGHSLSSSLSPEIIMVICGVFLWGFGTSLGHRLNIYKDNFVNSGIQMFFVGTVSLIWGSFYNTPIIDTFRLFSLRSLIGLTYLAVIGSFAFGAYNYLLFHEPSIRIVSHSLVNPFIAVLLGLMLGNEKIVPFLFVGFPMILCGLFLMLYGEHLIRGFFCPNH